MTDTKSTQQNLQEWGVDVLNASRIRFTGAGDNCDAVTEFLGGPNAAHTHQWKLNTNSGGWVIQADGTKDEFGPGDFIFKLIDGTFAVGHVCKRSIR